jgi:DNA-binding LacI/PurR family transcriptional regulator
MKKITIYDLAELSGVSASAVSAILNGNWKKRRISEACRKGDADCRGAGLRD